MKWLHKFFNRHEWKQYKTVPEVNTVWNYGFPETIDGTAVFSRCLTCGMKRKTWYQLKYKLVDGFLVHYL